MKSQLFILDRDMLDAMRVEDVNATWNDMLELGIAKPPFENFTIQIPCGRAFSVVPDRDWHVKPGTRLDEYSVASQADKDAAFRLNYMKVNGEEFDLGAFIQTESGRFKDYVQTILHMENMDVEEKKDVLKSTQEMGRYLLRHLIVALATRNVEKSVVHNRLAKFGLGKKRGSDYEYVTTIRMGELVEYEGEHGATGETRRPHLRRGHIRNQRYGPHFQYVKRVWIEPIFVNGYLPSDDHRSAYNVTKGESK